ncbi:MAG TPA: sugar ABC transporter substrate-binding protein [Chloroflexota bacterium]|nr:sugar ABC transporter substrate-binding protein [Chloroflexota bacterium]
MESVPRSIKSSTRRFNRRVFVTTTIGLMTSTALMACGQSAPGAPPTAPASSAQSAAPVTTAKPTAAPTASTAAASASAVRLQATNWSAVDTAKIYNTLISTFEKQNPSITVTYTPITAQYWPTLLTRAAGGVAPDAFWMNAQNQGAWAARNQLLDLGPLATSAKYDFSDFFKAGVTAYTWEGKLRALPSQVDNRGLFFNQTMFEKASVKLPALDYQDKTWTWSTFLDAAQHLTQKTASQRDPTQYGYLVETNFIDYSPWVWAAGGHFMSEDRTASKMTDPATVAAFQFLQDLIQKYHVAPTPDALSTQNADVLFSLGKIGMTTETISKTTYYRSQIKGFTWDAGALPAGNAGFANQSSGPAWSVSVQTKHSEEAWLLSSFLCDVQAQEALAGGGAELPSRISVAKKFWDKPDGPPAHGKVFLDGMNNVHPNPFVWNWSEIETMLVKELGFLWDGSKTAQQVMQEIDPQMNKLLQAKAPTA